MKSNEFIIWLRGFMEACNDFTATPKQWDRVKEVLNQVQDYNDNPGIDDGPMGDYEDFWFDKKVSIEPNGTSPLRYTGTIGTTGYVSTTTGNSFFNTEKQQLND
jgi:hypothetical protein